MVKLMKGTRIRIWAAYAKNLRNKIESVRETLTNRRVDFVMISEAAPS